jgi:hypothetical protein
MDFFPPVCEESRLWKERYEAAQEENDHLEDAVDAQIEDCCTLAEELRVARDTEQRLRTRESLYVPDNRRQRETIRGLHAVIDRMTEARTRDFERFNSYKRDHPERNEEITEDARATKRQNY